MKNPVKMKKTLHYMKRAMALMAVMILTTASALAQTADYIDKDGVKQTCSSYTVVGTSTTEWNDAWYLVSSTVEINGSVTVTGAVNLILADDAKLTVNGTTGKAGIIVSGDGNSLTIYGQTTGNGELIANGAEGGAGIGGSDMCDGGNITINGGDVKAYGAGGGAGIGGGADGLAYNIEVNRGVVLAQANGATSKGNGIGSGEKTNRAFYEKDGIYHIANSTGMLQFAATVKADKQYYSGKTVVLDKDINLNNMDWEPIAGGWGTGFAGTFDGQNHKISNIKINKSDANSVALFSNATGTFKDLELVNADVKGYNEGVAVLVANSSGVTFNNVKVSGIVNVTGLQYVGTIGGKIYGDAESCVVAVEQDKSLITCNFQYAGGIFGWTGEGTHTINNCQSNMNLLNTAWAATGGIVGITQYGVSVTNCVLNDITITQNSSKPQSGFDGSYEDIYGYGAVSGIYGKDNTQPATITGNTGKATIVTNRSDVLNYGFVGTYKGSNTTVNASNLVLANNYIDVTFNGVHYPLHETEVIGDKVYPTFAEAIAAVPATGVATTMKMRYDVTTADFAGDLYNITAGKNVVIDLNGKTISATATGNQAHNMFHVYNGATLTINDSSDTPGTITYKFEGNHGYVQETTIYSNGDVNLVKGSIKNMTNDDNSASYAIDQHPNRWGETYTDKNPTFHMTDGYVYSVQDEAIRMANFGVDDNPAVVTSVIIDGGTVEGYDGIFVHQTGLNYKYFNVTVNGGTLTGTNGAIRIYGPEAQTLEGGAIPVGAKPMVFNLSDEATYTTPNPNSRPLDEKGRVIIQNTTDVSKPENILQYCQGLTTVATVNDVPYPTYVAALEAAAENGATVELPASNAEAPAQALEVLMGGDVTITANEPVTMTIAPTSKTSSVDNDGIAYIRSKEGGEMATFTVGENVTLKFPVTGVDGAMYVGYSSTTPANLVINGRIEAYEPYIGALSTMTINPTGSLKSVNENLITRWGSVSTINGVARGNGGDWSESNPQVDLAYTSQQGGVVTFNDTYVKAGAWWNMQNRNGKEDYETKLVLNNTKFSANGFSGSAKSSGTSSAYSVELKNNSTMTINGTFATIADGVVTIETGSMISAKSIDNKGTINVDMTNAANDSYKIIDYTGTGTPTYGGTINVTKGLAQVIDKDLWVVKSVAEIVETGTGYATLAEAITAATAGQTVKIIKPDTYTLPASLPNNITVTASVVGVKFNCVGTGSISSIPNGVTFENVGFDFGQNNYHGFAHAGTINMNGCTLNGKFFSYGVMNFTGCTFNQDAEDYHMWCYGTDVTYTNCEFNGKGKFLNVFCESNSTTYNITATNCTFNTTKSNKAAFNVKETCGSTMLKYNVVISGCTINGNFPAGTAFNPNETLWVIDPLVQVDDRNTAAPESGIKVTLNEQKMYPNYIAKNGDKYYFDLATALNAAATGETVELLGDVDLNNEEWTPIANFKATFDGGNHTISNLTVSGNNGYLGFFGTASDATIKNLNFTDANISGKGSYAAVVAGSGFRCNIDNVNVSNSTVNVGDGQYVGGIVGGQYTSISNCTVTSCNIKGYDQVGGLIGYICGSSITNCQVNGSAIEALSERAGGLAGKINIGDNPSTINIDKNKITTTTAKAPDMAGGITAQIMGDRATYTIKDNEIDITCTASATNPIGCLRNGQNAAFTGSLAANVTFNTWTEDKWTGMEKGFVYSNVASGVNPQKIWNVNPYVAMIGETGYMTLAEAIAAATAGQTVEIIKPDTYTLPASMPNNITVKASVVGVKFNCVGTGSISSIPNGVTFENVGFDFGQNNYHGFAHAGTINMNGCTLNGKFFSYGVMNFTGCTFNQDAEDYHMWCYGTDVTYTNCEFNGKGKFLNVFCESNSTTYNITATNCTFNTTKSNKAAFNVKETCGANMLKYNVVISNCTTKGNFPAGTAFKPNETLWVIDPLVQVDDRNITASESGIKVTLNGVQKYPADL